jgi:hypothetical protein
VTLRFLSRENKKKRHKEKGARQDNALIIHFTGMGFDNKLQTDLIGLIVLKKYILDLNLS